MYSAVTKQLEMVQRKAVRNLHLYVLKNTDVKIKQQVVIPNALSRPTLDVDVLYFIRFTEAAPWLRRLATGIATGSVVFETRRVHVGFLLDKVAGGQVPAQ
jgi:hypothetical protein